MLNFIIEKIFCWIRKNEETKKAKEDYRNSRGKKHENMLEVDLRSLETIISRKKTKKDEQSRKQNELQKELRHELKKKAFIMYFQSNYDSIEGVGQKYLEQLRRKIDKKPIEDWKKLDQIGKEIIEEVRKIDGIGQRRFSSIKNWYIKNKKDIKIQFSELKKNRKISAKKRNKLEKLKEEKKKIEESIEALEKLKNKLVNELENLRKTTAKDFVLANKNPDKYPEAARRVDSYLQGLYPQWEDAPVWYDKLESVIENDGELEDQSDDLSNYSNLGGVFKKLREKSSDDD